MNTELATEGTKSHEKILIRTLQYYWKDVYPSKIHLLVFKNLYLEECGSRSQHLKSKGRRAWEVVFVRKLGL